MGTPACALRACQGYALEWPDERHCDALERVSRRTRVASAATLRAADAAVADAEGSAEAKPTTSAQLGGMVGSRRSRPAALQRRTARSDVGVCRDGVDQQHLQRRAARVDAGRG